MNDDHPLTAPAPATSAPAAPSTPSGTPNGAPPTSDIFLGAPATIQAALTGEPGTLPEVWCRKCNANVKPEGKGTCPRCHTFLKLNFVARRHPINVLRRDQLYHEIVAEYATAQIELGKSHAATWRMLKVPSRQRRRTVLAGSYLQRVHGAAHRTEPRNCARRTARRARQPTCLASRRCRRPRCTWPKNS